VLSKGLQPDALPPPSRLEAAVRNLAAQGAHRALIGFVELWSTYQQPPAAARLAEARAFLALAQVDRAWIRLQELAQDPDADVRVLTTAAELFLARGWPGKARQYLNRALADAPDDAHLQALWDRAAVPDQPPPAPQESRLQQVVQPDVATELVALAERHLARGQRVVGRGVLERVLAAHPDHERAKDLLWALQGASCTPDATLADLTERYAPIPLPLGDFIDENTESITAESALATTEPDDRGESSFPSLFRGSDAPPVDDEDEDTDEITQSLVHIGSVPLSAERPLDPGAADDDLEGDTRIVRVRSKDGVPEPIHRGEPTPQDGFDLQAFRKEMGVEGPELGADRISSFGTELEDEDDELVVLTGRERGTPEPVPAPADPTRTQIGREVAHLMGGRLPSTPEPVQGRPDPAADTPAPARPGAQDREGSRGDGGDSSMSPSRTGPSRRRLRRRPVWPWVVVLGLILLSTLGAMAVLLVGFVLG